MNWQQPPQQQRCKFANFVGQESLWTYLFSTHEKKQLALWERLKQNSARWVVSFLKNGYPFVGKLSHLTIFSTGLKPPPRVSLNILQTTYLAGSHHWNYQKKPPNTCWQCGVGIIFRDPNAVALNRCCGCVGYAELSNEKKQLVFFFEGI